MERKSRKLQLKLKTENLETITFLLKELLVIQKNCGRYPIHIEWKMHKVKYSLHVNKISFMNELLQFNYICNIKTCILSSSGE